MPNKFTKKLLTTKYITISLLEAYILPNYRTDFFFIAFNEDFFFGVSEENNYKANLFCLLAAMSDEDLNDFLATFKGN